MPLNARSSTWNFFVLEGNIKKTSTQETCITHAKQNGQIEDTSSNITLEIALLEFPVYCTCLKDDYHKKQDREKITKRMSIHHPEFQSRQEITKVLNVCTQPEASYCCYVCLSTQNLQRQTIGNTCTTTKHKLRYGINHHAWILLNLVTNKVQRNQNLPHKFSNGTALLFILLVK